MFAKGRDAVVSREVAIGQNKAVDPPIRLSIETGRVNAKGKKVSTTVNPAYHIVRTGAQAVISSEELWGGHTVRSWWKCRFGCWLSPLNKTDLLAWWEILALGSSASEVVDILLIEVIIDRS